MKPAARLVGVVILALGLCGCGDESGSQPGNTADNAALLMLLGTGFLNGYNQARPVTTTCFRTGMMTQCTTP
jgi:hypothetical protein